MKRIILTGGGTAGHVTPNIALLPRLRELGYDIHYIGSYNGIEKELIEQFGIPYHGISSGKLRRYFSVQNFTDPFRVLKGLGEAKRLIKILKPDVCAGDHPRIRHDAGTGQQAGSSLCDKSLLQLPGDAFASSGREGCADRIPHPSGTVVR